MRMTRPPRQYDHDPWAKLERVLEKALPSRQQIARHEASHTVLADLLGSDIRRVVVRRDMSKLSHGQLGGWVECGRTGDHFKDMTIDLAGEVADRIFSNSDLSPPAWEKPDKRAIGHMHDLESACAYAARLPGDPDENLHRAWARAVELVKQHRAVISDLAAKLERKGELDGYTVRAFLNQRLHIERRTDGGYIRRSTWQEGVPGGGIFQATRR